ncbi:MAG: ExbD/TolR family protein [Nannocystaceae bacterium]
MAGAPHQEGLIAGINVTPLVDIVLVLLIIFIVTSRIVVTPAVPMDLPQAAHTGAVQNVFSVMLLADGTTTINGEAIVDTTKFVALARSAAGQNPDLRAVIHADGSVPHRRVLRAIDQLKQGGVAYVAFAATPLAEPAP